MYVVNHIGRFASAAISGCEVMVIDVQLFLFGEQVAAPAPTIPEFLILFEGSWLLPGLN